MLTEDITGYDRFSVPISEIPEDILYEVGRGRGLDERNLPEGTDVQYWELESALESIDNRRDHKRALDAAIQRAVEKYDERSYDLILTNIDYDISDYEEPNEWGRRGRDDKWYRGEIDLLLVNIDDNWARAVEVKPCSGLPRDHNGNPVLDAPTHKQKAREQYERQSFAFNLLNEEADGFRMHYTPEKPVFEPDLRPEYEVPDEFSGRHFWTEEARDRAFQSENFLSFLEHFVIPENPMVFSDRNRLKSEKREEGEFIREFLNGNR